MRTRCLSLWALVAVLCAQFGGVFAAALELVSGEEQFLFGGREMPVRVAIRNAAGEAVTERLSWRLYQASSATLAPVGEAVELEPITFPAGHEVVVSIPVTAPQPRGIGSFRVKVFTSAEELGSARLRVCPEGLLEGLEKLAGEVGVFEAEAEVGELLQKQKVMVADLAAEADQFAGKLALVRLTSAEAEREWKTVQGRLPAGCAVLFIVSPGVTGSEILAPMKFGRKNGRAVGMVQEWFVPALAESPLSQLRLLRAAELLLKPEDLKFPVS